MNSPDLIEAARALAESGPGRPAQARLRRAVSTAYYAMFHALAASSADLFIGRARSPAWHRTYRALEHGQAKIACRQARTSPEFPAGIRHFARVFVLLQVERQKADYALNAGAYRKSDAMEYIGSAERAIRRLTRADIKARRGFAAHVLFRQRTLQEVRHGPSANTRDREGGLQGPFRPHRHPQHQRRAGYRLWRRLSVVEVRIIYDAKMEEVLNGETMAVRREIMDNFWREEGNDAIWPQVHFIAKSDIGRQDPATV